MQTFVQWYIVIFPENGPSYTSFIGLEYFQYFPTDLITNDLITVYQYSPQHLYNILVIEKLDVEFSSS